MLAKPLFHYFPIYFVYVSMFVFGLMIPVFRFGSWIISTVVILGGLATVYTVWTLLGALHLSLAVNKSQSVIGKDSYLDWTFLPPTIRTQIQAPDLEQSSECEEDETPLPELDISVGQVEDAGIYRALSDSDIRLLRPCRDSSEHEGLAFELIHTPLHKVRRTYAALSYCWGEATETRSIKLNNRRVAVRPNLESALLELRHLGHDLVWVSSTVSELPHTMLCSSSY